MLDWMKPEDMKKISELLSENFDFVLVDCPAGVEDGFKNALAACKEAIVVTCLLYTSPSPRDQEASRMPSSA